MATLWGGGEGLAQAFLIQLLVLLVVLTWVWGMVRRGRFGYRRTPLDLPLVFLFLLFLSSTLLSPYRYSSWVGFYRYLSYLAVFLIAVNLLRKPGHVRTVGLTIVFLSLGEASYAIYQHHGLGMERVAATLSYSTYLMDYLALGLSLTLGMVLFESHTRWRRFLMLSGSVLLLYTIFLTGTRAGVFSLLAIFVTLGALRGRGVLLCFLVLLLMVILIPNPMTERLLTGKGLDIYAFQRLNIWKQSLRVGLLSPFSGVGFGNFEFFSRRFNFPVAEAVGRYGKIAKIAHNQYLQFFADLGILGLFAGLYWTASFFKSLPRSLRSMTGLEKGFLAGVVAFLIHSLFDNPLHLPANAIPLSLSFGFLISRVPLKHIGRDFGRRWAYLALLLILGLASLNYLARPAISSLLYRRGREYAEKEDYSRAIELCERASFLSPGCAAYYDALGKLYSARFQESEALTDLWVAYRRFQFATRANPFDARLLENRAHFLVTNSKNVDLGEGQRDEEVVRLLKKAITLAPYDPFIRGKLAWVYFDLGRFEEAKGELERVIELEPNFVQAYYRLAVTYEKMGDQEKARDYFRKVLSFRDSDLGSRAQSPYEEKLLEFDYKLLEGRDEG